MVIVAILFILFSINFFRHDVFINRNSMTAVDYLLFISFVLIIIFLIMSELWMINNSIVHKDFSWNQSMMILFGAACFIIIFAEKVIADEIGREMSLGWETFGESIIMNLLLMVQLVYTYMFAKFIRNN